MRTICENCKYNGDCFYIRLSKEALCLNVQTYDSGYKAAVEKISALLESQMFFKLNGEPCVVLMKEDVEELLKAMEE